MHRRTGFTIIELLVTISIMLMLMAAVGINISNAQKNSRDARRIGDVLLIAKAIDQSAALNRGVYPKNALSGSNSRMCASEIYTAANPNNIDISIFSNRKFPHDPSSSTLSGCLSMTTGYTYHTQYGSLASSFAVLQNTAYTLEVGLENSRKLQDEPLFLKPSELPPLSSASVADSASGRYRFIFNGKYCGSSPCYN